MPPDETVWSADPHTVAKQRIYRKYFQAWFPIVQQGFDCGATYAEGFAGPGEYKNGYPGSPLNAVSVALRCVRPPSRDRPVGFVFVEARDDRLNHLSRLLRRKLGTLDTGSLADCGIRLSVINGRCEENLPGALSSQRSWGRPLLVVLDTWGAGVSYRLLKRIGAKRFSEVIVTFEPQHFVRFAGDPEHFGDAIFGPIVWRDVQQLPSGAKARHIESRYRDTLKTAGFEYVLDFELADEAGHALYLLHGTKHPLGVERMKDAMWDVDPYQGVGYRDPRDPDQEMLAIQPTPQTGPLGRLIIDYLQQRPGARATIAEVRQFVLLETIYKKAHATPIIEQLVQQGYLRRTGGSRQLNGKSVVVLSQQVPLA